jgi:K+-transporting ATPase KdpF subunit
VPARPDFSSFLADKSTTLAHFRIYGSVGPRYIWRMSIELILTGAIGMFLFIYLVYSIVRPERF